MCKLGLRMMLNQLKFNNTHVSNVNGFLDIYGFSKCIMSNKIH